MTKSKSWGNVSVEYNSDKLNKLKLNSSTLLLTRVELDNIFLLMTVILKSKVLYPAGYTLDLGKVHLSFYKYGTPYVAIHVRRFDSAELDRVRITFDTFNTIHKFIEECLGGYEQ